MKKFKTIDEILDFAINNEIRAYKFYIELAQTVSNDDMKNEFLSFAEEEKKHEEIIRDIRANKNIDYVKENIIDLKISDYISETAPSSSMTYKEALILAMKREKSAYMLYKKLSTIVNDTKIRSLFNILAQEEAKHKLRFEMEYDEYIYREN